MKRRKEKIIFLSIAFLFILALTSGFALAAEQGNDKGKALEIIYPEIPGVSAPKVISSGLPGYVEYIFHLSILLIGLIILGALIYNGIQYSISFGNPEKLSSAKQGIISAFLGAIILLSSYLIFNTINPQLTILELPEPEIIEPVVSPGFYFCDYKVSGISNFIRVYKTGNKEQKIEATKVLKKAMIKEENGKGTCFKVNRSANFKNFAFNPDRHTVFVIPEKKWKKTGGYEWIYNFGIIFHEKDNSQGKCDLGTVYAKIGPHPNLGFSKARSVTIFKKPDLEPVGKGITLYQCVNYNEEGNCPEGISTPGEASFKTGDSIEEVRKYKLEPHDLAGDENDKKKGTRSIRIDPEDSYFAILFSEDNFKGDTCEVIWENDDNLLDRPIGRCGWCGWSTAWLGDCYPCLKSMYVVKGEVF